MSWQQSVVVPVHRQNLQQLRRRHQRLQKNLQRRKMCLQA
jgi:hypothetical protein